MNDAGLRTALHWFPLVGWARPACPPLGDRVAEVATIIRSAREPGADARACAANALNKAALLASDCGMPDLASDLCWQHIDAYRKALVPLTVTAGMGMLGPSLNLARLRLRADDPDAALRILDALHRAVSTGTNARIDGRELPLAGLTGSRDERYRLRETVWRQYLTEGIRAHAMAGRWRQAAELAEAHQGIGAHLMEGRQAAIIASLLDGDADAARGILAESTITEPWEKHVAACLAVMCAAAPDIPAAVAAMTMQFLSDNPVPGRIVFRARTGLAMAAVAGGTDVPAAHDIIAMIVAEVVRASDGYAARDILQDPAGPTETADRPALARLVTESGLGKGEFPVQLRSTFDDSVRTACLLLT
jgi:hypothetical protein